ncbi:MAG: radical SAM protein [Clostridiales bacterium]|nr:radical SAM protein [Clostridiales bacterium]
MRCKYCYEGAEKSRIMLSSELMRRALELCREYAGDKEIDLTLLGGEPLLNRDVFLELMDLINDDDKIKVTMTTNGTIWDDEIMKRIVEKKVDLSISIDGDEKTHFTNRVSVNGSNLYEKTQKTIRSLLDNNIPFAVRMTVATNNVSYFCDNVDYFYKMGIKHINSALNEFENWSADSLRELDEQMRRLDDWYIEHIDDGILLDMYDGRLGELLVYRPRYFCSAGRKNHFVITADGKIYPCNYVANDNVWEIGDIYSGIDSERFEALKDKFFIKALACSDCGVRHACISTRCGFKNYKLTGWLNKANDDLCNLEKIMIRHTKSVFARLLEADNPRLRRAVDYLNENGYQVRSLTEDNQTVRR